MRLFVGMPPDDDASAAVADLAGRCKALLPHAKWVPPENLHYTIEFIGHVDNAALGDISSALDRAVARFEPFELALGSLGRFPPSGKARVIWIGARVGEDPMAAVAAECARALTPWVEPEDRPFAAHLTVARFRSPERMDLEALPELDATEPWLAEGVVLYESRLARPAPTYHPLHVARFGRPER